MINLPFLLVADDRLLVHQGEIDELNEGGKVKRRHVYLFNDIILCVQQQKSMFTSTDRGTYEYKWHLTLSDTRIGTVDTTMLAKSTKLDAATIKHAIGLLGKERKILLAASAELMSSWLEAFTQANMTLSGRSMSLSGSMGMLTANYTRPLQIVLKMVELVEDERDYQPFADVLLQI